MPFRRFFARRRHKRIAHDLYDGVVALARRPVFYTTLRAPDTVDGRFDLIVLHAFLLMHRLGASGDAEAKAVSQALFDILFADMDRSLREMGVGDLVVAGRVRKMAEGFYGRVAAFDKAWPEGRAAVAEVVARNLYREALADEHPAHAVAGWMIALDAHLNARPLSEFLDGRLDAPEGP